MSDDLELGGMLLPDAEPAKTGIHDELQSDVAAKLAFIGIGQGGSNLAASFWQLGYRRVGCLNTTHQDLDRIQIPAANKLDLGGSGAQKDMALGAAAVQDRDEDLYDFIKRSCGTDFDYAIICFGAGGGTGAGAAPKLAEVLRRYMEEEVGRPARVGCLVALPKQAEGQRPARNTLGVCRWLQGSGLSPIILLDNARIEQLYPGRPEHKFWPTANQSITQLVHLFNRLAAQSAEFTTFDRAELFKLLDSGLVCFGAQPIKDWSDDAAVSQAILQQLRGNVLAELDLKTSALAALVFVAGAEIADSVPASRLDHAFGMLTRILANDSVVFRGVYQAKGDQLLAFTMLGGLQFPHERLKGLARVAGMTAEFKDVLGG